LLGDAERCAAESSDMPTSLLLHRQQSQRKMRMNQLRNDRAQVDTLRPLNNSIDKTTLSIKLVTQFDRTISCCDIIHAPAIRFINVKLNSFCRFIHSHSNTTHVSYDRYTSIGTVRFQLPNTTVRSHRSQQTPISTKKFLLQASNK